MNILVIGAGYVGLTTATMLAGINEYTVYLYDKDTDKIYGLLHDKPYFNEPSLWKCAMREVKENYLVPVRFLTSLTSKPICDELDMVIVCVGTPSTHSGNVSLEAVDYVVEEIRKYWPTIPIILRSTVPPGTTDSIARQYGSTFVYWPEFLREGHAIEDATNPERIVIGVPNEAVGHEMLHKLGLEDFNSDIVYLLSITEAELVKYAANAFLSMKISYANLVADFCTALSINSPDRVLEAVGSDSRIGGEFLKAGLGFGGSCLQKDLRGFIHTLENYGVNADLFHATLAINEKRVYDVISDARRELHGRIGGKVIAVLGLAFKPGTSDIRDSQALKVVNELLAQGAYVRGYDPLVKYEFDHPRYTACYSIDDALKRANCIVIALACEEFSGVKFPKSIPIVNPWRVV